MDLLNLLGQMFSPGSFEPEDSEVNELQNQSFVKFARGQAESTKSQRSLGKSDSLDYHPARTATYFESLEAMRMAAELSTFGDPEQSEVQRMYSGARQAQNAQATQK